ncbi:hypothetical protein FHS35_009257 [Streptomyces umbrinus]|nr:hypothetical protein [Streptomyces umbrinus]MCX4564246.1 hypothetical protein [Streptomyces phaeochromogenes]
MSNHRGTVLVAEAEALNGSFTRNVPAGRQTLTGEHGGAPCQQAVATVTAGAVASVQVICQRRSSRTTSRAYPSKDCGVQDQLRDLISRSARSYAVVGSMPGALYGGW